MREKKIPYSSAWRFTNSDNPVEFVKMLCDSFNPSDDIYGYGTPEEGNISAVKGHYSSCKDPKLKKKLAEAITTLMKDDDYRIIAISAASELYLEEALPEFKSLSKLSLEELRNIKTVYCTNALFCILNYSRKFYSDFSDFYIQLSQRSSDRKELAQLLRLKADVEYSLDFSIFNKYIEILYKTEVNEATKIGGLEFVLGGVFKKYGDKYCIDLAKRFKESLSKEYQLLYYKALESNGKKRFHEHLEELKKILEI